MGNTKGLGLLPMSSEWLRTNRVTVGNQLCQMLLFILGQLKMGSHSNRDASHYTTGSSVVACLEQRQSFYHHCRLSFAQWLFNIQDIFPSFKFTYISFIAPDEHINILNNRASWCTQDSTQCCQR